MKKLLILITLFIAGFVTRVALEEIYTFIPAVKYEQCINDYIIKEKDLTDKQKEKTPSAYQHCKGLFKDDIPGDILTYNPVLWCNVDASHCQGFNDDYVKVKFLGRDHFIKNDQLEETK